MKLKINFYQVLIFFLLVVCLLHAHGNQNNDRITSIYNQITNEEQHQQMLNLQLDTNTLSNIYSLCRSAAWIEETPNAFIVAGNEVYYKSNHGVMHKLGSMLGMDIPLSFLNVPAPPITNEEGLVTQPATFYQKHAYKFPHHFGRYIGYYKFDRSNNPNHFVPNDHIIRIRKIMQEWTNGTKLQFLEVIQNVNLANYPIVTGMPYVGKTPYSPIMTIKRTSEDIEGQVRETVSSNYNKYKTIVTHVTYHQIILEYPHTYTLGNYPGLRTNITTNGTLITNGYIIRKFSESRYGGYVTEPKIEFHPETITVHTNVEYTSAFNQTFRHELGHYIGFPHEHQKWNRNDYIQLINNQNANNSQIAIIPQYREWRENRKIKTSSRGCGFLWLSPCYETVSVRHSSGSGVELINGFDYESVMNYSGRFYIKGTTKPLIVPGYVSEKDNQAVNIFYP